MKKKVLVVDDSSFMYEDMKRILNGTEFQIAGYCVRGENAVDGYESLKPDVVTMDIVLPGMDGFETAEKLLESHPEAKIVIVSSLAYDDTEERAKELGIEAFVFKPFEPADILRALRFATGEDPDNIQQEEEQQSLLEAAERERIRRSQGFDED